ncbi:hypothetical protein Glove_109g235 [Diversispora epigaea]|uniref:Protein kinase domain-containing protein n=1 Tax=Diversispora epigaea TaxID=1348612 RepID=A0A397J5R5_9GLOM|nr:hypothetical protein Glove_109g235 [Diversispora epigaea]
MSTFRLDRKSYKMKNQTQSQENFDPNDPFGIDLVPCHLTCKLLKADYMNVMTARDKSMRKRKGGGVYIDITGGKKGLYIIEGYDKFLWKFNYDRDEMDRILNVQLKKGLNQNISVQIFEILMLMNWNRRTVKKLEKLSSYLVKSKCHYCKSKGFSSLQETSISKISFTFIHDILDELFVNILNTSIQSNLTEGPTAKSSDSQAINHEELISENLFISEEIGEIKEMKEKRKAEEMEETGETEESDDTPGKCSKCHQDNTGRNWCHPCNAKQFQNEFDKWTSGDREIDKFIQQIQLNANKFQEIIEWIPFDRLENVIYLDKGGFSTVYKANWLDGFIKFSDQVIWHRNGEQGIKNQLKFRGKNSIAIYGITKNPTENEYMMVMNYAEYGSLRNVLNNIFNLTWWKKSSILYSIIWGLKNIHEMGLMHKDLHPGNIVNQALTLSYITDFGLCKPVTENDSEKIYGVIPYMAPETLSRGEYTQASDIYSFGMVMLEVLTSYPPYYNIPHDENLAMDICKGLKPEIKCKIPEFFKEIMGKCWNFEPHNRPTAEELKYQLKEYFYGDKIRKQIKAADKSNENFIKYDPNKMHPEAIYTSRLIPKITISEYDTFNSRQQFFSIPDKIIVEYEENETQETECKFNSLEIN